MNHDVVENFKKKLRSRNISDYYGLKSPGLTCYLNSVLQVLFMTEDFREAVKQCCIGDPTTIDSQLAELFSDLEKEIAKTHKITRKLEITNVYEQRDAAEYFEKILCLTSPEASKIFKGELNHRTKCLGCKSKTNTRSFFWILPLTVEDSRHQISTVEKGLESFFRGEKASGENMIYCSDCDRKQNAEFGYEISQHPQILTLLLKRFSFNYKHRRYVKLHSKVEVPKTLHMMTCSYDLFALVDHFGELDGGHYTAHIKSFETQAWYHFNDDIVKGVRHPLFGAGDESLRSRTAYLLMYRKVRQRPERSDLEAHRTSSDIEAEAKWEETPVPLHQLEDDNSADRNLRLLNGDFLKHDHDAVLNNQTPGTHFSHGAACSTPHKEMMKEDGGRKRNETIRRQFDRDFKHRQLACVFENKQDTRENMANMTYWGAQKLTDAQAEIKTRWTDRSPTTNRTRTARTEADRSIKMAVKGTATKGEKSQRNAAKRNDTVKRQPWK